MYVHYLRLLYWIGSDWIGLLLLSLCEASPATRFQSISVVAWDNEEQQEQEQEQEQEEDLGRVCEPRLIFSFLFLLFLSFLFFSFLFIYFLSF